ncbi:MAG: TIR domain-containing protein [Anaerolineae bacterium]
MNTYRFDVYVSHSAADREWVDGWLVPRLEAAGVTVAVGYRDLLPGVPLLDAIEQTIAFSRHALIVITPSWTADEWNAYEARLTHTFDPNARRRKLIPVRLKPCTPPDCVLPRAITDLVMADFTEPHRWEAELHRLLRALQPVTPPHARAIDRQMSRGRWLRWWFSYYRRRLTMTGLLALALVLTLSAAFGWPTFPGWRPLGRPIPQAWRLYRAGDVLLVSTATDAEGCALVGQGLWRSTDGGGSWQVVNTPLRASAPGQSCFAAAIADFAHSPFAPKTIYATTTNAGLLRSTDAGLEWTRIGQDALPAELTHVTVAPQDAGRMWVAGTRGGLFGSRDGGASWERLDGAGPCVAPQKALPASFVIGALAAVGNALYAGSWLNDWKSGIYPGPEAGLYVSWDGGHCWARADDAEGRYGYADLKEVTGRAGELLVLVESYRAGEGNYTYELWLLVEGQGRIRRLWATCGAAAGLLAGPGPATWTVATMRGRVTTGSVDVAADGEAAPCQSILATLLGRDETGGRPWPPVRRCALPSECFSDLAADDRGVGLLLLMGNRVYRPGDVSWPLALWP